MPSAVIADLDFLAKDGELRKVLTELGTPENETHNLCARAREAIRRIRSCIAHVDPKEIQNELQSLAQVPIDLGRNGDAQLRGRLQQLGERLYRLHNLKQLGVNAIPMEYKDQTTMVTLRNDVDTLLSELSACGLFLVPVGELESWLPVLMKGQGREDKSRWAMLAAEKIEDVGERPEDVWQFMRTVYDFLEKQLRQFAGDSA